VILATRNQPTVHQLSINCPSTVQVRHAKIGSSGTEAPEADARLAGTIILNLKLGPVSRNAFNSCGPTPPSAQLRVYPKSDTWPSPKDIFGSATLFAISRVGSCVENDFSRKSAEILDP
jgi:hypothetical protein